MGIKADYTTPSKSINGALIRLDRIWGSKKENWNAWVHVYEKSTKNVPTLVFSVQAPYVEGQNPYEALYAEVSNLSFLSNVEHDIDRHVGPILDQTPLRKTKTKTKKV